MGAKWKITSQRQTTVNDGNTYVPAMVVGFVTGTGNAGNVTFTHSEYTTDNVKRAIQEAADRVDEVGGLRSAGWTDTGAILGD